MGAIAINTNLMPVSIYVWHACSTLLPQHGQHVVVQTKTPRGALKKYEAIYIKPSVLLKKRVEYYNLNARLNGRPPYHSGPIGFIETDIFRRNPVGIENVVLWRAIDA